MSQKKRASNKEMQKTKLIQCISCHVVIQKYFLRSKETTLQQCGG